MNLYVGNLAYEVTDDDLKTAFQVHGEIQSARVIMDRYTGRSKGFGFVEMANNEQAQAAITALNGTQLSGRAITVNEARPKPQRDDRGPRGGGGGGRGGFGGGEKRRF
ncbi:MAG TPA: RNA-binding protein [Lentisphaeria bacterium]|nr:MAG: RNA-binding protein [Lentisphaerae bacterium GWF2_49_21]HBC88620.1 RNA-binding protein [Lentisphaeria bacterium]